MDKGKKVKKILKTVTNVLFVVFLLVAVFAVVMTVVSKKDSDGAAEIFGHQMRIVTSESMAKCDATDVSGFEIGSIPIRSMVFIEVEPEDESDADEWYADLKVGDVLTFKYVYNTQVVITHRIVSIEEKKTGGYIIELEGDNKNADQNLLSQRIDTTTQSSVGNQVIGKVVGQSVVLGNILAAAQQPLGIVLIIIVPCLIIIIFEVIKIANVVSEEKRKAVISDSSKKDDEIEELKRRLAELETSKEKGGGAAEDGEAPKTD